MCTIVCCEFAKKKFNFSHYIRDGGTCFQEGGVGLTSDLKLGGRAEETEEMCYSIRNESYTRHLVRQYDGKVTR